MAHEASRCSAHGGKVKGALRAGRAAAQEKLGALVGSMRHGFSLEGQTPAANAAQEERDAAIIITSTNNAPRLIAAARRSATRPSRRRGHHARPVHPSGLAE